MFNVHLLVLPSMLVPLPLFWASAKSYYELHGKQPEKINWIFPYVELLNDLDEIKDEISKNPPNVFAMGLYVWNSERSYEICKWVKETWPNCVILLGGPSVQEHPQFFTMHPYIDAYTSYTVMGELSMLKLLDMYDNLTTPDTIDWNKIYDSRYPSQDKSVVLHSTASSDVREFIWDYSAYEMQHDEMLKYNQLFNETKPKHKHRKELMLLVVESVRGCPYKCAFCTWGGSKLVVKPSLDKVEKDLEMTLEIPFIAILMADSNFGILGERDVQVARIAGGVRNRFELTTSYPDKHYCGITKSDKHVEFLKEIIKIEAEFGLNESFKLSTQAANGIVLENVARTNLSTELTLEVGEYARDLGLKVFFEIIFGLPGTTVDNWYEEFNDAYNGGFRIYAHSWILLPNSDASTPAYREKFKLETIYGKHSSEEFVVGTYSYTREDYCKMLSVSSIVVLFLTGGIYENSIKEILTAKNWKFSDFLKAFNTECYPELYAALPAEFDKFEKIKKEFVEEGEHYYAEIKYEGRDGLKVSFNLFLLYEYWYNPEVFGRIMHDWILSSGANPETAAYEEQFICNKDRIHRVTNIVDFTENETIQEITIGFYKLTKYLTKALSGKKKTTNNIHLLTLPSTMEPFPLMWASSKSYYELYGASPNKYNWILPISQMLRTEDEIKVEISKNPPDVFAMGIYVWNIEKSLRICRWVKETYPSCLIVLGGPNIEEDTQFFIKYPYIDAYIANDVVAEVAILKFLDKFAVKQNNLDWSTVPGARFPNAATRVLNKSLTIFNQNEFKWDYSAYDMQIEHMKEFAKFKDSAAAANKKPLIAMLETNRGCPYSCTFCRWGGEKLMTKDIPAVQKDIELALYVPFLTFFTTDTNFGVMGNRDVEVAKLFASTKAKHSLSTPFPMKEYSGLTKVDNRLPYLKEILKIDVNAKLVSGAKLSVQSFDKEILGNIKRVNMSDEAITEIGNYVINDLKATVFIELIFGLPGQTIDTLCKDFNIIYKNKFFFYSHIWYLTPNSESNLSEYKERLKIETVKYSNEIEHGEGSFVVQTYSYTKQQYREMLSVLNIATFFIWGGLYCNTINEILTANNWQFSDFLKAFYIECYPKLYYANTDEFTEFERTKIEFVNEGRHYFTEFQHTTLEYKMTIGIYLFFIYAYWFNAQNMDPIMQDWFKSKGASERTIAKDAEIVYYQTRMNTSIQSKTIPNSIIIFNRYNSIKDIVQANFNKLTRVLRNVLVAERKPNEFR